MSVIYVFCRLSVQADSVLFKFSHTACLGDG